MEKIVVIFIVGCILCAWIAWLIYNFKVINNDYETIAKINYYKKRYENLQDCVNDLISAIHHKFPESTVEYIHNNEGIDRIEGEIKY